MKICKSSTTLKNNDYKNAQLDTFLVPCDYHFRKLVCTAAPLCISP